MPIVEILERPSTHNKLVEKYCKNFNSEWIVIKECRYKKYAFDILAFNPRTGKIKIVEVDLTSPTPQDKRDFIETFADLTIITPNKEELPDLDIHRIIKAVSNKIRLKILDYLYKNGDKSYTEIIQAVKMNPTKDAGRFAYHINYLCLTGLIESLNDKYTINEKGVNILDFFMSLEK